MMLMLILIKVVITLYMMRTIMSMIVVMILIDRLTKNGTDNIVRDIDAHFDHRHLSTSVNIVRLRSKGR